MIPLFHKYTVCLNLSLLNCDLVIIQRSTTLKSFLQQAKVIDSHNVDNAKKLFVG